MGFEVTAVNNYNLELPKAFILLTIAVNIFGLLGDTVTVCITVSLRLDNTITYDIRDICQGTVLGGPRGALCGVSGDKRFV